MNKTKGKDLTKTCWSCGRDAMQPVDTYFQCAGCGATYDELPLPGTPALSEPARGAEGYTRGHPRGAPR